MCVKRLNMKFITTTLKILLPILLLTGVTFAQNTNTTSSFPFHVCHAFIGDGNVNCTGGGIYSYSGDDVGYYNFSIVNVSAWNVSEPVWKLYPLEDSYISSRYPAVSFYDSTSLQSGAVLKLENLWTWVKFDKSSVNYCDKAYICLYRYSSAVSNDDFKLYYSHNQTWTEAGLTWNVKPDWNDAHVSNLTMAAGSSDDTWYCWDIADAYCDNVNDNATYMLRVKVTTLDNGTVHANYTTEGVGAKRSYDLYVDEANSTGNFNDSSVIELFNKTGASKWGYLELTPNSIYFPGSRVNNATLYMYVPGGCNQSLNVSVYRTYEENTTDTMTWYSRPQVDTLDLGKIGEIEMNSTGWKTLNITDAVQRSALSGGWLTSNISLRFTITTNYEGENTLTTLNNSKSSENFNFTTTSNQTTYIKIPKFANITTAYFNITGKETWTDEWNLTLSSPVIYNLWISGNGDSGTKSCTDTEVGSVLSSESYETGIEAGFLFNMTPWNVSSSYNWTAIYANWTAYGGCSGGSCTSNARLNAHDGCGELTDRCPVQASYGTDCGSRKILTTESLPGSYDEVSVVNDTDPDENNTLSISAYALSQAEYAATAYSKWESGSYLKVEIKNFTYSYPENVSVDVTNDTDWDWTQTGTLNTENRTTDLATEINAYMDSCTAGSDGYCSVPIVIHVDGNGTVKISDIEINYTVPACFASSEYDSYDPKIEIGYAYTTKDAFAYFNSSDTAGTSYDPYLIANISWNLNATSNNGTFEPFGQTETQWIHKVCSDPEANGPIDIYLNLTDIVNSTDDSLTELPACVSSFWHYGNLTNVDVASAQNITGNTAKKILDGLKNGTCAYIWENLTFSSCTVGDAFSFNFSFSAVTESFGG